MHEIKHGALKPLQARQFRDEGGLAVKIHLKIDAMSIISALSASKVKAPSEKSMLGHLLWLKELLDLNIIEQLCWVDTRDMSADGHTKGSIDRTALQQLARGLLVRNHSRSLDQKEDAQKQLLCQLSAPRTR